MSETTGGTKHDQGKPPMHLIPWEAMEGVARVMAHGETKYGTHQWRGGFAWGRLAGACLRHLFAWLSGQDKDPESGESHIDHALCCLMFLTAHIKSGLGKDDRYKAPIQAPAPDLEVLDTPPDSKRAKRWYVDRVLDAPTGSNPVPDAPRGTFDERGYSTRAGAEEVLNQRSVPKFWRVVCR